jgi:hypothetical protein
MNNSNKNKLTRFGRREPFQNAVERIDEFLQRNREGNNPEAIQRAIRRIFGLDPEGTRPPTNAPAAPESLSGHEGVA